MGPLSILLAAAVAASAQDYRHYLCEETRQPFFAESGPAGGPRKVTARRRLANPVSFEMPKPVKTRRILVVGESVAAVLWEKDHDPLTEAAQAAWPGQRVEDVNAGMTAYNSRRIAQVLEEGLKYDPDLVVVLSGHNETDALELCPSLGERVERDFRRSPVFRRLREAFPGKRARGVQYDHQVSLARHEFELRRMARLARERGVPLVLATLPANERDYSPGGEAPWQDAGFARAAAAFEHGDFGAAARGFERRVESAPFDPMAHWFLARAFDAEAPTRGAEGSAAQARPHYEEAARWDGRGDRASDDRDAMIRRVAKEEGAAVADLDEAFRKDAPDGAPGGERIADGVHWYRRFNTYVAAVILDAVEHSTFSAHFGAWDSKALAARLERGARAKATAPERREELKKVLLYGIRQASYWGGTDQEGRLNELPVTLFDRVDLEARGWLLEISASTAAMRPQLVKNYWVQDLEQEEELWWPIYSAHLAEMYRRKGEPRLALRFFDEALRLSPQRWRWRLWRALALKAAGRAGEARAEALSLKARRDSAVDAVARAYGL